MRIDVSGSPVLVGRLRAYAEYRVFSLFAAFAHQVRTVRVVLSQPSEDRPTTCAMSADLPVLGRLRSRSRGTQPTRAIDAAARKLADSTRQRLQEATGSDGGTRHP
jgi:ribosome-associated translation inhibitor RaiA